MKRILLLFSLVLMGTLPSMARHITGGEMFYRFISESNGLLKYRVTLKLYRDCFSGGAPLDPTAFISLYNNDNGQQLITYSINLTRTQVQNLSNAGPCINNPPIICYEVGYYEFDVDVTVNDAGYTLAYQRCCRIEDISNVSNSGNVGATYTTNLPGRAIDPTAYRNNSAIFSGIDTVIVCENNFFVYNFGATDEDNDQLSYEFCSAYLGASTSQPQPPEADGPPYQSVPYSFGFTAQSPLGANVTIDPNTGLVSGTAPEAGIYVITVCVKETRNGKVINTQRKDLQIKIAPCTIAAASLRPEYITCDGFTLTFENRSNSPIIRTYFWDFGVPGVDSDTSISPVPTFTYSDTGTYRIMLITNRNQDCSDTAYALAKVYPGFRPDFNVSPGCKNVPVQFFDATQTDYGVVDKWRWNFGYPASRPDTSRLQNPTYTYPNNGLYDVRLIVGNSKGCIDTIFKRIEITDRPRMDVTNDTLICSIDTLQLNATGSGSYVWTPNYNINNPNAQNPLVSPDVPTTYVVTLTVAPGCVATDSVRVNVVNFVTLDAGNDTTICLTDPVTLRPRSDGLQYAWTPTAGINNPTLKNPIVTPTTTTTYSVTASIGKCNTTDQITVRTVPYPDPIGFGDTTICYNDTAFLRASNAETFIWFPANTLETPNNATTLAYPLQTTNYVVQGFESRGCPKPGLDTVVVQVIPPIPAFAGNDTAIVIGQPLQLNARGGTVYQWTPPTGLSDPNIPNPIASLSADQTYAVYVGTPEGCFAYDTINVRVFLTAPDIFVPTGFTPNNDGLNDVLRAIPVGIQQFDYFRIFNRWGQLVFSTNNPEIGWDGALKGKDQGSNTFVWMVRGTDYTGKVVQKKGTVTLIR